MVQPWRRPTPFHKLQWLFPIAVTVHNLEEAIWLPGFVATHAHQIPWTVSPGVFRLAIVALTLAAWMVTFLSSRSGRQTIWAYLVFGYMIAMLANVFVPHIPSVFVFQRYVPGFGTAVVLDLPVLTFLSIWALREAYVSGTKAVWFGIGVPVGMAATTVALFAMVR
ncbi:MAG TPA: HXXEE domain-containing protein [Bryobacteraceae bacterium]|nr:HXXEE domain-containing protein [Bryobacteraceae bacterium]